MKTITVSIKKLDARARLPAYETEDAAGMDIHALLDAPVELAPLERAKIPTGLALEIPAGFEAQIRPRSGLALKNGLTVLNAPGTIDADYRGELAIIIINLGKNTEVITDGDRIAQMVFAPAIRANLRAVTALSGTARRDGGFGSTGR